MKKSKEPPWKLVGMSCLCPNHHCCYNSNCLHSWVMCQLLLHTLAHTLAHTYKINNLQSSLTNKCSELLYGTRVFHPAMSQSQSCVQDWIKLNLPLSFFPQLLMDVENLTVCLQGRHMVSDLRLVKQTWIWGGYTVAAANLNTRLLLLNYMHCPMPKQMQAVCFNKHQVI